MKYLVVNFNRYDTENSTYHHIEAKSSKAAIMAMWDKSFPKDYDAGAKTEEMGDIKESVNESFIKVDKNFSCVPGEEQDILVYKI